MAGSSVGHRRDGAPGRIRTCGQLLRRQLLYPLSYGRLVWLQRESTGRAVADVTGLKKVEWTKRTLHTRDFPDRPRAARFLVCR